MFDVSYAGIRINPNIRRVPGLQQEKNNSVYNNWMASHPSIEQHYKLARWVVSMSVGESFVQLLSSKLIFWGENTVYNLDRVV